MFNHLYHLLFSMAFFLMEWAQKPNCTKLCIPEKVNKDSPKASRRTSVTEKFNVLKIGTVFEYHVFEIFKFSLNQIPNGFKTLSIGTQNRQTRNRSLNIWNLPTENDRLDSRAIILINALRKWVVLPTDELICGMDEKFFSKFLPSNCRSLRFWYW